MPRKTACGTVLVHHLTHGPLQSVDALGTTTNACLHSDKPTVVHRHRKKIAADRGHHRRLFLFFSCILTMQINLLSLVPTVTWSLGDWYKGIRIGEASNPGPANTEQQLTFAILNPTVLTERQQDIIDLNADTICLAETSATATIQAEFNAFLSKTPYRANWGPPVKPQKAVVNPLMAIESRRGEALGTASLHRTPHRQPRLPLDSVLEATLRVTQQVMLIGHIEVLVITAYFFAGKTPEVRTKSDLLLAELYSHCTQTDMPYIIAADFNNPVREFPAYRAFQSARCQEAFHLAQTLWSKNLPPTCRNATKNDSFIIHPALIPWIRDIWVGPPNIFPDHRPLFMTLVFPGTQKIARTWYVPASWGDLPLDHATLENSYRFSPKRFTSKAPLYTEQEVNNAFARWSKGVEGAVRACIATQHKQDPIRFPLAHLPQKFWGRCQPTKFVSCRAPKTVKMDPTLGYEPPIEVTSNKSRLKARQTRWIISLIRHLRKMRTTAGTAGVGRHSFRTGLRPRVGNMALEF